jgi:hypothetical protein
MSILQRKKKKIRIKRKGTKGGKEKKKERRVPRL